MKILHLLSSNIFTNTENSLMQSALLLKDNFDIAYASPDGQISKVLRYNKINYFPIENWDLKTISSVIETYSPDVIHAHDFAACQIASKFSKNSKILAQIHLDCEDMKKMSLTSLTFNRISKNFSKIIWPSEHVKNNYKYFNAKKDEQKNIIFKPAIDCENVISKSQETENDKIKFDMLMFIDDMEIDEIKKVINILALLQGRGFTFKFGAISSSSTPNPEVIKYLDETGINDSFMFINKTDNYYFILAQTKILFIAKKYEDTPIYALEAGALGIPVLSVFCNGLKSVIQNEFNGFLADNEYDLANFAARMLDDRQLWLLLSTNALSTSYIQNDLEKYKNELINLYK